jgi:hypothetical protein
MVMTKDKLIIEKLTDRIAESKTVLMSILSDLKADSVGKVFVENEIKYITQLESELSTLQAEEEEQPVSEPESIKEESDFKICDFCKHKIWDFHCALTGDSIMANHTCKEYASQFKSGGK